jgi:hypothetical protein
VPNLLFIRSNNLPALPADEIDRRKSSLTRNADSAPFPHTYAKREFDPWKFVKPTEPCIFCLGEFTPNNESPIISHRVSTDGGNSWSAPVTVNTNVPRPHGLHRGVDARIAVHGNNLVAAWTSTGSDKWGSGPIITVRSEDGGKTWTQGPNPADDGLTDGHNYLALGADASGRFHMAWLDARDGERGRRYSVSSDAGLHWASNSTPAPKTCECCWNAPTPLHNGGIAILYRARAPRDMFLITSPNAGAKWNTLVPVGDFKWEIDMWPHVGGALTPAPAPMARGFMRQSGRAPAANRGSIVFAPTIQESPGQLPTK